jgi:hypothetical protein
VRLRCGFKDIIKIDVIEVLYEVVDWIKLTQGSLQENGFCEYGDDSGSIRKL